MKRIDYYRDFSAFNDSYVHADELLVLLIAENTDFDMEKLLIFNNSVFGAIFPQIIFQDHYYETGLLVLTLAQDEYHVFLMPDMKSPSFEEIDNAAKSLLMFVDGSYGQIECFLEELFLYTDEGLCIIGGSAGKRSFPQDPVIFDQNGMYKNAALFISSSAHIGVGVNHGWKTIDGPFTVTSAAGNLLKEINNQNAFEFYASCLYRNKRLSLNRDNFFEISKTYPIGIKTFDYEPVVRNPINFDGNGLFLAGRIEKDGIIFLLEGDADGLIEAARQASEDAVSNLGEIPNRLFIIDSISRSLLLKDAFQKEIESIHSLAPSAVMFGVLAFGEIANRSDRYIEFFNKTCVIGAI
jgi:hypothetical protein